LILLWALHSSGNWREKRVRRVDAQANERTGGARRPSEYDSRCRAALKSFTPAPFGAIIADMFPRIIHIPLSGGDRKVPAKGMRHRK